jgi:hypothetical protein
MVRTTPSLDGVDDDGSHNAASHSSAAKVEKIMNDPTRRMDRDVAVACSLRVQPGINMTEVSSYKRPVARVLQLLYIS